MPTYLQLAQEPVWGAQITPPNMTTYLLAPLRAKYGLGPAAIGAAGDNNHVYGRHRSRDWCLQSRYCTDRSYGTQDARDKRGDGRWYRGFDVGITGKTLQDASRRMDELTRSGRCPGIAEWFGTFDGVNVSGWFEGRPSSSDDSHLWHLHGGVWTEFANDPATMQMIYAAITGEDDMTPEQNNALAEVFAFVVAMRDGKAAPPVPTHPGGVPWEQTRLRAIETKVDAALAAIGQISTGNADVAAILAGVQKQLDEQTEALEAEVRDAVADLGEGGSAQVRADA